MDYKDRLPTEEQIMSSLQDYFTSFHARINALGDLDVNKMKNQEHSGYYLELSKDIKKLISDFVNIYGYIYKNGEKSKYAKFVRGTIDKEVESLSNGTNIGNVLSVTNNEQIAKRFGTALIRVSIDEDIPYVYVENIKDSGGDREEEFLLLPFTEVNNSQFVSNWNGIKYYSMRLGKQELPDIEDAELETLRNELVEDFPNFETLANEYLNAQDKYEKNSLRMQQSGLTMEDRRVLSKAQETLFNDYYEKGNKVNEFRNKFSRMLKGLCRQREKDIDMQIEDETQERLARQKAEAKEREDKLRQNIAERKQEIKSSVGSFKIEMEGIVSNFVQMAKALGIETYNTKYDVVLSISGASADISQLLDKGMDVQLNNILDQYNTAFSLTQDKFQELTTAYKEKSFKEIKAKLNEKIKVIIESSICSKFEEEKKQIEQQKDTLFSRLLGRNVLKKARLNNLSARQRLALSENNISNPNNSVRQMLQEMYNCAYKYNGKVLTQEMRDIETAMRANFVVGGKELTDEKTLWEEAARKTPEGMLPDIQRKIPRIFRWYYAKKEIKRLKEDTAQKEQDMEEIKKNKQNRTKPQENYETEVGQVYARISDTMESIRIAVNISPMYHQEFYRAPDLQ